MSIVLSLDMADEETLFPQLLNIITRYEKHVDDAEPLFKLEGKKLEEIARTLPYNLAAYDRHYQEMKTLEEWLMVRRDKIQAKLWKKYLEGYARALASKDIQMYIQGDKEYVEFTEIILEVGNIRNKLHAVVEGFTQMGWMIGHITKLRIAELQDVVL